MISRGAPRDPNPGKDHVGQINIQQFQNFQKTIILKILIYPLHQGVILQRKSDEFPTKVEIQQVQEQQDIPRPILNHKMLMPRCRGHDNMWLTSCHISAPASKNNFSNYVQESFQSKKWNRNKTIKSSPDGFQFRGH